MLVRYSAFIPCTGTYTTADILCDAPQVPMVIVTEWLKRKIKKPFVGNVIFWISFCIIGQPLCMIMYYHDYVHFHMSQQQMPFPKLNLVPGVSTEYNA